MSRRSVVWMFSGQGSQFPAMGRELFDRDAVFRASIERCDEVVRPMIEDSLVDILYRGPEKGGFDRVLYTHPSICAVQYGICQVLRARGHVPDILLGYSLGEMTAHIIAGSVSLETGFRIIHQHACLMEVEAPPGAMLAILAPRPQIEEWMESIPDLWLAARNFPDHQVIAGKPQAIDDLENHLKSLGLVCQRLPVVRAFHSPLMDSAEKSFVQFLQGVDSSPPAIPILSATSGKLSVGIESLWQATRDPVLLMDSVKKFELESSEEQAYVDVGPSGTMETFLKYMRLGSGVRLFSTLSPYGDFEQNLKALDELLPE